MIRSFYCSEFYFNLAKELPERKSQVRPGRIEQPGLIRSWEREPDVRRLPLESPRSGLPAPPKPLPLPNPPPRLCPPVKEPIERREGDAQEGGAVSVRFLARRLPGSSLESYRKPSARGLPTKTFWPSIISREWCVLAPAGANTSPRIASPAIRGAPCELANAAVIRRRISAICQWCLSAVLCSVS